MTLQLSLQDELDKLRSVFDAFLAEYPLCYGYWKKYADSEARHQNPDVATQVYERGVAATPYSADLWVNYAAFRKSQPGATAEELRRCELIWFGLPTTTSHSRLTCPASADCCCWGLGLGTGGVGRPQTSQPPVHAFPHLCQCPLSPP